MLLLSSESLRIGMDSGVPVVMCISISALLPTIVAGQFDLKSIAQLAFIDVKTGGITHQRAQTLEERFKLLLAQRAVQARGDDGSDTLAAFDQSKLRQFVIS